MPEPSVSRSEQARRRLVRMVRLEVLLTAAVKALYEEAADSALDVACALKTELPSPGRPTTFLALVPEDGQISADELERIREIVRLQMTGKGVAEIARVVGISARQVR